MRFVSGVLAESYWFLTARGRRKRDEEYVT
jgi:hypothetical protein